MNEIMSLFYLRYPDNTISVNIYDKNAIKNDDLIWLSVYSIGGVVLERCSMTNFFYYPEIFLLFQSKTNKA